MRVAKIPTPNLEPVSLSLTERALSAALGLGLAAVAARPRPNMVLSFAALAAGSYLAWRGSTGKDPLGIAVMPDDDDTA